jgi:hypothetical protein
MEERFMTVRRSGLDSEAANKQVLVGGSACLFMLGHRFHPNSQRRWSLAMTMEEDLQQ